MENNNLFVLKEIVKNCEGLKDLINSVDLTDDEKIDEFFHKNNSLRIFFSNNEFFTNCYNQRRYFIELYERVEELPEINLISRDDVMNICYKNIIFGQINMNEDNNLKRTYDLDLIVDFEDIVDSQKNSSYDFKNYRYKIKDLCSLSRDYLIDLISQSYYITEFNYKNKKSK
jgi:hypothetical protein